jgi:hypothetical protein
MKNILFISLMLVFSLAWAQDDEEEQEPEGERITVNTIITDAPDDLAKDTLLVPRFDLMMPEVGATGERRKFIASVNSYARKSNSYLKEILDKNYPYPYRLVGLSEVDSLKDAGKRYFLDLVLMPKQMERVKKEAMVSAYRKYRTANKMYNNRDPQFHYYFYIRNLQTDDAYVNSRLRGNLEVYPAVKATLVQAVKDSQM